MKRITFAMLTLMFGLVLAGCEQAKETADTAKAEAEEMAEAAGDKAEDAMRAAEIETMTCDLMIAIGSSLVVYPAAGFPLIAKRNGAKYAILNRDETEHDSYADLVVNDEIGYVLGDAVNVN